MDSNFDVHDIPYDTIWLDIEHTNDKRYFTWHPSHFADPKPMLDALQAKHRHVSVFPFCSACACVGARIHARAFEGSLLKPRLVSTRLVPFARVGTRIQARAFERTD